MELKQDESVEQESTSTRAPEPSPCVDRHAAQSYISVGDAQLVQRGQGLQELVEDVLEIIVREFALHRVGSVALRRGEGVGLGTTLLSIGVAVRGRVDHDAGLLDRVAAQIERR